jgi:hypothetical protein
MTRFLGLAAALVAGGLLLALPPGAPATPRRPVPVAMAWPGAQRGVTLAKLADGSAYQPVVFVDARISVGTAVTRDGSALRLLLVGGDQPVRELRRPRFAEQPSFQAFTVSGDELIWAEGGTGRIRLWRAGVRDRRPARVLVADAGAATFYRSADDLVVEGGRLHWVVDRADDAVEVRSIALTGGPVDRRVVPGKWTLSGWPWLVDGITATAGTARLKNLITEQIVYVAGNGPRATTRCGPTWCLVATLARDGANRLDLMRPDGADRRRVAGDTAQTVITDVTPLDRYAVYSLLGPDSDLTGNVRLMVYELATRRTVEVSPDAGRVSYRNGVLSWATGGRDTFVWHALDLRTI